MNVFSVGLSGQFAEWCDAVALLIARHSFGEVELLSANTLEEVACEVIRTRSTNCVITAREPSARLCSVIGESKGGFILALDDPRIALGQLMLGRGASLVDALGAVARGCASAVSLAKLQRPLILIAEHTRANPHAAVVAMAQYFSLNLTADELFELAAHRTLPQFDDDPTPYEEWWRSLDARSLAIADGALGAYFGGFDRGALGPITWERDLFYCAEGPRGNTRSLALDPVDITGRPRCLISGPSITLPAGDWRATVALNLSPEATEMSFMVEVVAGSQLASARIEPGTQTAPEIVLEFTIDAALGQPIDIHVSNERAAFDGTLALRHVMLSPRLATGSDVRNPHTEAAGG
jgi:hypothetical protein